MNEQTLQQFLRQNIPAAELLDIRISQASAEQVCAVAPFAPNRNHKNTVFGGSIALLATLSGWALLHLRYPEADGNIVIQQGSTDYLLPAHGDLSAITRFDDETQWASVQKMLAKRGKARIALQTELFSENQKVAEFSGVYVLVKTEK